MKGASVNGSVYTTIKIGSGDDVSKEVAEVLLPDIEVFLHNLGTNADGKPVTTDFFGRYLFPRQKPGIYQLRWKAQHGWAAGAHPDKIVVGDYTRNPTPAQVVAEKGVGVVFGRVTFADGLTTWTADELFAVNRTGTVTILNLARTATLAGPVHTNANGYYAAAGIPRGQDVTIRAESEASSVTRTVPASAVAFGSGAPTDVELPNMVPEIVDVFPMMGANVIQTANPGDIITLRAQTRDGNSDPLSYSWKGLTGGGSIVPAGDSAQWTLSNFAGRHSAYLQVADGRGGYARRRIDFTSALTHVTFSGIAVDKKSGAAVEKADVTVNGQATTTVANGFFTARVPLSNRYVMNIKKTGYALFSRVVDAPLTGQTWKLVKAQSETVYPTQPITLVDKRPELERRKLKGMKVVIPAGGLVDSEGKAPTGPLTANLATLDIADGEAPGDWGAMLGGKEKNLISYGAGFVEFLDGAGKVYNLSGGVAAEVEFFPSSAILPSAQATAKSWSYNEKTGYWETNGTATLVPATSSFVNKVTHLSTINTDIEKDEAACLGVLIYPPISTGVKLRVTDPTGTVFSQAYEFVLDAAINAVYRLPANTDVQLDLLNADGSAYSGTVLLEEVPGVPLAGNVVNTGSAIPSGESLWPPEPYVPPCKLVILREANEPTGNVFLTYKGVGSETQAQAYYAAVDPLGNRDTLREWWETNRFEFADANGNGTIDDEEMFEPPTNAIRTSYLNDNDLGSGRDMYFLKHADGTVSAYVTNYGLFNQDHANADHAADRDTDFLTATVCMEYSPVEGEASGTKIVKFFVYAQGDFGPNAPRQTNADLDGFGPKFVPNLCLNCHGGNYRPTSAVPSFADINMGSSFRELDIATYKFPEGNLTANATEKAAFKQQNLIVKGGDADAISVQGIKDLITGWYLAGTNDQDNSYTPPGWNAAPEHDLYRDVVRNSCRTCHVALGPGTGDQIDVDWTSYNQLKREHPLLKSFVLCQSRYMPHAIITYRNFWLSASPHRPAVLRDFSDGADWTELGPCPSE
jgi:hypothetical protein